MEPYIGVTGFTARWQALELLRFVPNDLTGRRIMIGVLASARTLRGLEETRGRNRHPKIGRIRKIFADHPLAFNAIHFHSAGEEPLGESLRALAEIAGPRLHAIQLNIPWPPPGELRACRDAYPSMGLILQIGRDAIAAVKGSPIQMACRLGEYAGLADAILFDPSGGEGILFKTEQARAFLEAIEAAQLGLGLGVAGGFSPETLSVLDPLAGRFPRLSIDAEGRLRSADDQLILSRAAEYIRQALAILGH